jgi:hypothetical protein
MSVSEIKVLPENHAVFLPKAYPNWERKLSKIAYLSCISSNVNMVSMDLPVVPPVFDRIPFLLSMVLICSIFCRKISLLRIGNWLMFFKSEGLSILK